MSKAKQLKLNKLFKELEFLRLDLEYKNELINESDSDFISEVNKFLEKFPDLKKEFDKLYDRKMQESDDKAKESDSKDIDKYEEPDPNEEVEEKEEVPELPEVELSDEEKEKKRKLKEVYRSIAKITHPDKTKNDKYKDVYIRATDLYEKEDLMGLYLICSELGIEYDIVETDEYVINDTIHKTREKITFLESTFTWKWIEFKDNEEMKNNLIISFIKNQLNR